MDSSAHRKQGNRVVVVEDDVNLALLLRYNLEARGYAVRWFSDGAAAWAGLNDEPPEAVILDWELPSLAGIEVLRRMRACNTLRSVPVLILTARCHPEDRQRAFETGASAFLAKPFSFRMVFASLDEMFETPGARHSTEMAGAL